MEWQRGMMGEANEWSELRGGNGEGSERFSEC
jgi:hypothetical protein